MTENWQAAGFGLYLHWPFCQAKCPYCDFNSHVAESISQTRWRDAYLSEIDRLAEETPGRVLGTVYFGGGTPSLMHPEVVGAVLERIARRWPMVNDPEITLEANPTSVEAGRFQGYRDAGVNRVSLGVQALIDDDLKRLGRRHDVGAAKSALEIAQATFDRVSFDLIYARQGQTLEGWRAELTEALALASDHLSLYQLTIEPGTAFGARHAAGGLRGLPGEELSADMYAVTQEICEAAGLPAYEISNHARDAASSRHNLIYWRQGDYLGIGPGGHGRLTFGARRFATLTPLSPDIWLKAVECEGFGENAREEINNADRADDYLMMSLRLREGVEMARYDALGGSGIQKTKVSDLTALGLVKFDGMRLSATAKGRPVLNAILRELMVG